MDIHLEDPDVEAAATKIQAGFRGSKARQNVKNLRDKRSSPEVLDIEEDDDDAVIVPEPSSSAKTAIQIQMPTQATGK